MTKGTGRGRVDPAAAQKAAQEQVEAAAFEQRWKAHPNEDRGRVTSWKLPPGYQPLIDAHGYVLRDLRLISAGHCKPDQVRTSVKVNMLKLQAVLDWLDKQAMSDITEEAAEISAAEGS